MDKKRIERGIRKIARRHMFEPDEMDRAFAKAIEWDLTHQEGDGSRSRCRDMEKK